MAPSEFWCLSPTEFWWEFDARVRAAKKLNDMVDKKTGKFSQSDWAAARMAHSMKMEKLDG